MKIKRIEHVAIAVTDMADMLALFRDKLGLKLEYAEEIKEAHTKLAMLPVGQTYIELLEGTSASSTTSQWIESNGPGLFHLCLEVDDIEEAMSECRSKGIRFREERPMPGHGGSSVAFMDPATTGGVVIELMQPHT